MRPETYTIKINGQKVRVRVQERSERINSRCLQSISLAVMWSSLSEDRLLELRDEIINSDDFEERLKNMKWYPSTCVGERNDEHGHGSRIYIEVLSPFFQTGSDDSGTEEEDKGKADL